jgi:hypothetical protein
MDLHNERFVFEISIDAVPHTKETSTEIYGENSYNPDFGVESHAIDLVFTALNDGYCRCLRQESKHIVECKCDPEHMNEAQKQFHDYLEAKTRHAEAIRDSLKFVRMEKISKT